MGFFDRFRPKQQEETQFSPVPDWKPDFSPSVQEILDRVRYYPDGNRDIAVFRQGTCVLLEDGLSDAAATESSLSVLSQVYNYHPDMNPVSMDDGNILVQYNHPMRGVFIIGWDWAGNPYGIERGSGRVLVEDHHHGSVHEMAHNFETFLYRGLLDSDGGSQPDVSD